jgi:hypothetical protein
VALSDTERAFRSAPGKKSKYLDGGILSGKVEGNITGTVEHEENSLFVGCETVVSLRIMGDIDETHTH